MSLLEVRDVTKTFPGVVALDRVSMSVAPGEVHALLGENGAGKSTLLKVLSGAHAPDSGTIEMKGEELPQQTPLERQRQGIVTIYQEFNLVPCMSVADNIFIGREPLNGLFIDRKRMLADARNLLRQLKLAVDPNTEVRSLSVAEQQLVEIAKALSISADVIIMDEPTAALSEREVTELHALIGKLRSQGVAIIYVTHRLDEVFEICDRFTVLRDGRFAGHGKVADFDVGGIIRMMVGRNVEPGRNVPAIRSGAPALEAKGVMIGRWPPKASTAAGLSITVGKGEIVGLAGLVGSGRTEFARAIFGADSRSAGQIIVDGTAVEIDSPGKAMRCGVALVPEDRKQQGIFANHSIKNNFALPNLLQFCRAGYFISERKELDALDRYRRLLRIRMSTPGAPIGTLSGGNQQKVLLARCMAQKPKVLIVDEPTRGIDVGSKAEVHQLLRSLAEDGMGVLVISSELPEILAISDRVVTMREGVITGNVKASDASEEGLMALMAMPNGTAEHAIIGGPTV